LRATTRRVGRARAGPRALRPELFLFGVYALSFIKVGIYWSNHHHMLQAARRVLSVVSAC